MIEKIKAAYEALKLVATTLPEILKQLQAIKAEIDNYKGVLDTLTKQVNDIKAVVGRFKF